VRLGVERLLVQDCVERDRGLAGFAVTDDQLALATTDRNQRIDRLEAGGHRLVHRLARNDAGRLDVDALALSRLDRTLPSIGLPSASTTRPSRPLPTGAST